MVGGAPAIGEHCRNRWERRETPRASLSAATLGWRDSSVGIERLRADTRVITTAEQPTARRGDRVRPRRRSNIGIGESGEPCRLIT